MTFTSVIGTATLATRDSQVGKESSINDKGLAVYLIAINIAIYHRLFRKFL